MNLIYTVTDISATTLQNGEPDYVTNALITAVATENYNGVEYTAEKIFNACFRVEEKSDDFTPYSELTESIVLQWFFDDVLGEEGQAKNLELFQEQLDAQKPKPANNAISAPQQLPWA